jgi:endonuclease YncB( thermonuclease family)
MSIPDDIPGRVRERAGSRRGARPVAVAALVVVLALAASTEAPAKPPAAGQLARIARVVDGDTVALTNGEHVRLVQIDTPEVYFSAECYGEQASAIAKRLLPAGTLVRLSREAKTDAVDRYGRLLRYVFRARDGLNVNVELVKIGAAAPYFYDERQGRYASVLVALARRAQARHLGLWGRCPGTPWDPNHGVSTGPAT